MWSANYERGEFILLEQFISPVEADIVAGRLQSERISVMLLDQHMVWNNLLQSQALGGVKILVKRRDLEIARRIMEDVRQGGYCQELGWQSGGKTEVTYNTWGRILLSTALIIFLFILPLIGLFRIMAE
ncbi:TPA: DUF2007 domain-containing protein [Salmonella enterica]|nr:DUF2007 domain-containing protein [Salmonella enterica subsp. enterica serovar Enteritidis]HAF5791714.1 DUF2007 domain-containing protein [Salmonella enterica]